MSDIFICTLDSGGNFSTVLPVEIFNFIGKSTQKGNLLQWSTSEQNNIRFELERSANGLDFEKLASISGAGNSNAVRTYTYTDKTFTGNISYYRLKQVDVNEMWKYSSIISIKNDKLNMCISLFPNLANTLVNVSLPASVEEKYFIKVYDVVGRLLINSPRTSSNEAIHINRLALGKYVLAVEISGQRFVESFIKN